MSLLKQDLQFTKNFLKQSKKLPPDKRRKLEARLIMFTKNPLSPTLRNHALLGDYQNYHSINITGDLRALYYIHNDQVIFDIIGTHSQLYD